MTDADKKRITDMRIAGMGYKAIATELNMTRNTIKSFCKRNNLGGDGVCVGFCVWENVPGAFNSGKGGDFKQVLEEIVRIADDTLSIPMPKENKWLSAGEIVGDGFSVAWRTIDARFWVDVFRRVRCYDSVTVDSVMRRIHGATVKTNDFSDMAVSCSFFLVYSR